MAGYRFLGTSKVGEHMLNLMVTFLSVCPSLKSEKIRGAPPAPVLLPFVRCRLWRRGVPAQRKFPLTLETTSGRSPRRQGARRVLPGQRAVHHKNMTDRSTNRKQTWSIRTSRSPPPPAMNSGHVFKRRFFDPLSRQNKTMPEKALLFR